MKSQAKREFVVEKVQRLRAMASLCRQQTLDAGLRGPLVPQLIQKLKGPPT
ncbi:hypothetical protein [Bradyrhizobium sp. RDM4]|uniref:hypothetical protein n=1 Tax=Bradyrhizobium sp. RDM4 TaxID=3378765 RepID=UPI0038FCBCF7